MKHELGESFTLRTTRSSDPDIKGRIVVEIPRGKNPLGDHNACKWVEGKGVNDYYWGCMNTQLYDFTTYGVAVDPKEYFSLMGEEIPKNMANMATPVIVRPKELYETYIPAPPTTAQLKAMRKAANNNPKSNGSKRTKKGN